MSGEERPLTIFDLAEKAIEKALEVTNPEIKEAFSDVLKDFKLAVSKEVAEFISNFVMFIWDLIYRAGTILGEPAGYLNIGYERGRQEASRRHKVIIPSLAEIIDLTIKGYLDTARSFDLIDRTGVEWDVVTAIYKDSVRKASLEVLSHLYWRGILDIYEIYNHAQKLGYDEYQADLIIEAHRPLPSADELIYAFKKWGFSDTSIKEYLGWLGYKGWANMIKLESYYRIPSIQDIIRFMVREAFNPYAVERYRMLEEFPEDAVKYAEIQGLTRDWVEKYWIAHWELPSPTQVFDMYHRIDKEPHEDSEPIESPYSGEVRYRRISKEVINDYLKFADYLHYWRDKLLRISENVLTRVDVRRLYELGIFDEDDVFFAYIEAGYSEEHAKVLTDFTILQVVSEEINKVRNELIEAYVDGAISLDELRRYLEGLHINKTAIEILLAYAEWKKSNELRKRIIKAIRERFLDGDLDEVGVTTELAKWGFRVEEINRYLDLWGEERRAKRKYLTKTEIVKAFKKGIFDWDEAKRRLVTLGYEEEDAEVLLKLAGEYILQG